MLRITARGPDTYLLLAEDHAIVGWIRGRVLRFTGFASRAAAAAAALAGGRALAAYGAYGGGAALPTGPAAARPPSAGGGGDGAAARLVPPRPADAAPVIDDVFACGSERATGRAHGTDTYSVEFMLAEGLRAVACGTIAQALHAAIAHHDHGEPVWRRATSAA